MLSLSPQPYLSSRNRRKTMYGRIVCVWLIMAGVTCSLSAREPPQGPKPPKDDGWKSHAEYHAKLRQHLLDDDDKQIVEQIDAAAKDLISRKQGKDLWMLTQKALKRKCIETATNETWYAA